MMLKILSIQSFILIGLISASSRPTKVLREEIISLILAEPCLMEAMVFGKSSSK